MNLPSLLGDAIPAFRSHCPKKALIVRKVTVSGTSRYPSSGAYLSQGAIRGTPFVQQLASCIEEGTACDRSGFEATNHEHIILDITKPEQIAAAAALIEADGRPLRAVINNAGIAVEAPLRYFPWRSGDDSST